MIHFGIPDKDKIASVDKATKLDIEVRKGIFKYQQPLIEHYHYDTNGNIQNSFKRITALQRGPSDHLARFCLYRFPRL